MKHSEALFQAHPAYAFHELDPAKDPSGLGFGFYGAEVVPTERGRSTFSDELLISIGKIAAGGENEEIMEDLTRRAVPLSLPLPLHTPAYNVSQLRRCFRVQTRAGIFPGTLMGFMKIQQHSSADFPLSPDELDVIRLLGAGLYNMPISQELKKPPNYIRGIVQDIMDETGLYSRTAIVTAALLTGRIKPEECQRGVAFRDLWPPVRRPSSDTAD